MIKYLFINSYRNQHNAQSLRQTVKLQAAHPSLRPCSFVQWCAQSPQPLDYNEFLLLYLAKVDKGTLKSTGIELAVVAQPAIPALVRREQKGWEFKVILHHSEFEVSLSSTRPSLKNYNKKSRETEHRDQDFCFPAAL